MVSAMVASRMRQVFADANSRLNRRAPNPRLVNQTALAATAPTPKSHRSSRCSLASAPSRMTVSR